MAQAVSRHEDGQQLTLSLPERLGGVPCDLPERLGGVPCDLPERPGGVPRDLPERPGGVCWHEGLVSGAPPTAVTTTLCAGCREKEARYGFRGEQDDPAAERPRTLCFSCFRIEIGRRQAVAARLARGWNAEQAALPLEETLQRLTVRRRRAQIAARHALGL